MSDDNLRDVQNEIDGIAQSSQGLSAELRGLFDEISKVSEKTSGLADTYKNEIASSIKEVIAGGSSLNEVFKNLALSIADKTLAKATNPLIEGASGFMGNFLEKMLPFKDGGAIQNGVQAFADGGIVTGPVNFPMRGGVGLMGEAGPEAIVPLSRGADGKLGISSSANTQPAQVIVNISTPDISGFSASKTQIANQLKQAVSNAYGER